MPCKQNKSYKTKLNQCCPINPSLRNFYMTIHGLCLYGSYRTKQMNSFSTVEQNIYLHYSRYMESTSSITFFLTQIKTNDELTQDRSPALLNSRGNWQHNGRRSLNYCLVSYGLVWDLRRSNFRLNYLYKT